MSEDIADWGDVGPRLLVSAQNLTVALRVLHKEEWWARLLELERVIESARNINAKPTKEE